jgi:hypothetical protein
MASLSTLRMREERPSDRLRAVAKDKLVPFFGAEWCELFREQGARWPTVPGATAVAEVTVRDNDGSTRVITVHLVEGKVASASPGEDADAEIRMEFPADGFAAYSAGDPEPLGRAALNGQVRSTGDFDKNVALQPVFASPEFQAALEAVHARTKY